MCSALVLSNFKEEVDVILHVNFFDGALGAVLVKKHVEGLLPAAFASKKLSGTKSCLSATEKECLAILQAV